MSDSDFQARIQRVRDQIEVACHRSGRDPGQVNIIAVTKTFPLEIARKACAHSLLNIGENRVQEALDKYKDASLVQDFPSARLHLIGNLQTNKVRKAVQLFDSIDTVDSVKLAEAVSRISGEEQRRPRILLEVNTSGEPQKFGFEPTDVTEAAIEINRLPNLSLAGLMTVGPNVEDEDAIRQSFQLLRSLFESIRERIDSPAWSVLSMGMSSDFEIAIEEGATEVRLGSILFGSRR